MQTLISCCLRENSFSKCAITSMPSFNTSRLASLFKNNKQQHHAAGDKGEAEEFMLLSAEALPSRTHSFSATAGCLDAIAVRSNSVGTVPVMQPFEAQSCRTPSAMAGRQHTVMRRRSNLSIAAVGELNANMASLADVFMDGTQDEDETERGAEPPAPDMVAVAVAAPLLDEVGMKDVGVFFVARFGHSTAHSKTQVVGTDCYLSVTLEDCCHLPLCVGSASVAHLVLS